MSTADKELLLQAWDAAAARPFVASVDKELQFAIAGVLFFLGLILTGTFALNKSVVTLPALGIPASLAFGFGSVYLICAVGVYV